MINKGETMKNQIVTMGFLAIGFTGVVLLLPKNKQKLMHLAEYTKKIKCKVKIEPEKLACC